MPVNGNPAPQEQLLIDVADYAPVLPDAVTQQLLSRAGLDTEADPRIARISALAAQKVDFVKLNRQFISQNCTLVHIRHPSWCVPMCQEPPEQGAYNLIKAQGRA